VKARVVVGPKLIEGNGDGSLASAYVSRVPPGARSSVNFIVLIGPSDGVALNDRQARGFVSSGERNGIYDSDSR